MRCAVVTVNQIHCSKLLLMNMFFDPFGERSERKRENCCSVNKKFGIRVFEITVIAHIESYYIIVLANEFGAV